MSASFIIHIVDDDSAVRDGLSFSLGAADYDVRSYSSAAELLERGAGLEPGVIVTDVRMPGMTGLEMVAELKARGIGHPVIVMTGHADVAMAVEAMKAGVVDFLEKPVEEAALLQAIENGRQREAGQSGRRAEKEEINARLAQLTPRERDVFNEIAAGESNKSAALKLGISPRTVEIYRANVMEKMRARTLSDLVRMAILKDEPV